MGTPDKAIPDNVFADARCVAVIPSMIKIAIGFGGNHGKGVATCRTPNGWSAPAPVTITGGSFGFQFGGQAVDLVLLVMNQQGMDHLLASKFKLGADASAAAGPVGRHAEADTDWKMKAEVLSYSRARGAFAGVDLSGAAITQDKDETRILYGKMVPFSELLAGKVPAPTSAHEFLSTVRKYAAESKEKKESGSLKLRRKQPLHLPRTTSATEPRPTKRASSEPATGPHFYAGDACVHVGSQELFYENGGMRLKPGRSLPLRQDRFAAHPAHVILKFLCPAVRGVFRHHSLLRRTPNLANLRFIGVIHIPRHVFPCVGH